MMETREMVTTVFREAKRYKAEGMAAHLAIEKAIDELPITALEKELLLASFMKYAAEKQAERN